MSKDEQGYNGWRNYETWAAKLWMDNEESSYRYWNEVAQDVYNESESTSTWTRDEAAKFSLSDRLKDESEEAMPDLGASFWSDILRSSLSEVNWDEIAENLLADVDKDEEEEDSATEE